ncbi:hypothetical protein AB0D74_12270 [Streptomyces sp. NPDC048278]|uniref:hypothetical protein n=1 Tax=Streptomyces sp. NPDC048278 TaxID=3155809 RepID=UPI00341A58F5
MQKPPVFTPEEIARFRAELAARRAPGAHEPGRWSVSPLNRRTDVVGSLPETVRLRDATLRSLETLPGVTAPAGAKRALLRRVVATGVPEVVTAGPGGRDEGALKAEVDLVKGENPGCRVICPLMRSTEDVDRAARAGYDAVQVWVQGFGETALLYRPDVYATAWRGEEWRTPETARDRAAVLGRAARLVSYARSLGVEVIAPMLMVSYLTEEDHAATVAALTGAGAGELTLFDGPGAMSPEAYGYLVRRTRELAPDVAVGLHPHNTFGLAVGCAVAAVRAGADAVELSVNGYCGGPGNADLAATALAFEAVYGVRTGIRTEALTELSRLGAEVTGCQTAWNHPITGPDAFCWGGLDFITQETAVDPLLHNCVEPSLVGNERRIPFTPDSGPYTLADRTAALGIDLPPAGLDQLLDQVQQLMARENRLADDDDLRALARELG